MALSRNFNSIADTMSLSSTGLVSGTFDVSGQQARHQTQLDVTDFSSNKTFHVPNVKTEMPSGTQSIESVRQDVAAVEQDYVQQDQLVKQTFFDAMKQTVGAEMTAQIAYQLMPGDGVTKMNAITTMLDPTGVAGSIYAVLDTIHAENKRVPNDVLNAAIEKTMSALRQAGSPSSIIDGDTSAPKISIPEGLDFEDVSAQAMREFIERDVSQDQVMQDVQVAYATLDELDEELAFDRTQEEQAFAMLNDDAFVVGSFLADESMKIPTELSFSTIEISTSKDQTGASVDLAREGELRRTAGATMGAGGFA